MYFLLLSLLFSVLCFVYCCLSVGLFSFLAMAIYGHMPLNVHLVSFTSLLQGTEHFKIYMTPYDRLSN